MFKNFLVLLVLLIFANLSYAEEQITITTYYPSPYGSYKELSAHRMKIGLTYSGAGTAINDNDLLVEGNLGIGTTGPEGVLHIEKDGSAGTTLLLLTGNSMEYAGLRFKIGAANAAGAQDYFEMTGRPSYAGGVASGGDIRILRWDNPFPTNTGNLWLMPDGGNVGIGTTAPSSLSGFAKTIHAYNNNPSGVGFMLEGSNNRKFEMGASDAGYLTAANMGIIIRTQANSYLQLGTSNLTRVYIDGSGNVGIGTTTPGAKLEIVGDLKVTGNIIGSTGWTALPFGPLFTNTRSPTAQPPQYRKIGDIVYLRGTAESLQDGRNIQNGDLIGTLPSGFRPLANILFMQPGFITAELVSINSSGQIIAAYFNEGADWVSLDGIFFSTTP